MIQYRRADAAAGRRIGEGQNVALYRIRNDAGDLVDKFFVNNPGAKHSEQIADNRLDFNGINPSQVEKIYSERNFCTSHKCAQIVGQYAAAAQGGLSWTFDQGENAAQQIWSAVWGHIVST